MERANGAHPRLSEDCSVPQQGPQGVSVTHTSKRDDLVLLRPLNVEDHMIDRAA